jgi:hypothetical protein
MKSRKKPDHKKNTDLEDEIGRKKAKNARKYAVIVT